MPPGAATCRVPCVLPGGAQTKQHIQHQLSYMTRESQGVLGLKGPLKITLVQSLCHGQGHISLDQIS